jgi:hypothetical protein
MGVMMTNMRSRRSSGAAHRRFLLCRRGATPGRGYSRAMLAIPVIFLPVTNSTARAQAGLNAAATPCSALQSAVQREQAVIIRTGPSLYDRYVSWCSPHLREEPAYLRTLDTTQCFVGYFCRQSGN